VSAVSAPPSGPGAIFVPGASAPVPFVTVAASPASLNFGSIWNGDAPVVKQFTIDHAPRAGAIRADIAGTSPFHVVGLRVWGDPAALSPSVAQAAALRGSRSTTGTTGTTALTALSPGSAVSSQLSGKVIKANLTNPPFATTVAANDIVIVSVDFAPKWSLSENAGAKSSTSVVTGPFWKSEVPLGGFFNGLKLGMAISMQPSTLYAPMPSYVPGQRFNAWPPNSSLEVTNATGKAQVVALGGDPNPAEVQISPQAVSLAVGETRNVPLQVTWDPRRNPTGDYRVTLSYSGSTSFGYVHLQSVGSTSFGASGSGWFAEVTLTPAGEQRFSFQCFITGMQFNHDCTFYFYRDGQEAARAVGRGTSIGGKANDVRTWTTANGLTPDDVFRRSQSAWSVVEIDSSSGDPSNYPRIPLTAQ
jgi:hypothetical protein